MHGERADERVPDVLLVCSGLDHARRGFESFARECFEALRGESGVHLQLVKGSGRPGPGERAIPTLRRDRPAAQIIARARGTRAFRIEAAAFALALIPLLARRRPDVIYMSEWDTARVLAGIRALTRLPFKLLLCNGGFAAEGFDHLDHVQELTPAGLRYVMSRGADADRHSLLPLGFRLTPELDRLGPEELVSLRRRLGLPSERPIVLSVAALNRQHKRLDYVIEEIHRLPRPRPFLLLAGEPDEETPGVRLLAQEMLGEGNHDIRTVSAHEVTDLYRASDVFVLGSLVEAQGRALIEAMSHGLPCVAHDSEVTRFALGGLGWLIDMSRSGALTRALAQGDVFEARDAEARHAFVYGRFSWDRLRPRYLELFQRVALANRTVSSSTAENVPR